MFGQDTTGLTHQSDGSQQQSQQDLPAHDNYVSAISPVQPYTPPTPPTAPFVEPPAEAEPYAAPSTPSYDDPTPTSARDSSADDLLDIKQQALNDLAPLVSQLNQSPEEKFKTTMMMIQASDDHTLIKNAYDAAREIEDDEVRAHALLDVVNEINYFTSHEQ